MSISFITTVFNEENTIDGLLKSLFDQTRKPDEIIVVDGGGTDSTVNRIREEFAKHPDIPAQIFVKKGNRSVGRNEAIKRTTGDIIAISDAGCILDKCWLKEISDPFGDKNIDVVAGYYKGKAKTIFQKCLVPYVLVMEDKVNPKTFLPATRSMAMRKKVWEELRGFPEEFSHNEDYVFANALRKNGYHIAFQKTAIVSWIPRNSLRSAFWMFARFAYGDAEAKILRKKIFVLLGRYLLFLLFIVIFAISKSSYIFVFLVIGIILYLIWSIEKNYRYINLPKAFFWLPILQVTSDLAVIGGTVLGLLKKDEKGVTSS